MNNIKYLKFVYSFWAHVYDAYIDPLFSFDRKTVIDMLTVKKNDRIVEVGIGTGLNLPYYPACCQVVGVDISKEMIAKAKSKQVQAKVHLKLADARKLPFGDNFFDKALVTYVLRVSPDPGEIVKELQRVVKVGGKLVLLDQFARKNRTVPPILQPLKLLLGFGRDHHLSDLIEGTSWRLLSNQQYGRMGNTRLVVLKK